MPLLQMPSTTMRMHSAVVGLHVCPVLRMGAAQSHLIRALRTQVGAHARTIVVVHCGVLCVDRE